MELGTIEEVCIPSCEDLINIKYKLHRMEMKTSRGFNVFVRTRCYYETGSVIQSCNST
jgi:hypothetical protein